MSFIEKIKDVLSRFRINSACCNSTVVVNEEPVKKDKPNKDPNEKEISIKIDEEKKD